MMWNKVSIISDRLLLLLLSFFCMHIWRQNVFDKVVPFPTFLRSLSLWFENLVPVGLGKQQSLNDDIETQ